MRRITTDTCMPKRQVMTMVTTMRRRRPNMRSHEHEHEHGGTDMHLWLDPDNAKAMAAEIAKTLVEVDPANKSTYEVNLAALDAEIGALDAEIARQLKPVADKPFIVFHDAYQYFERTTVSALPVCHGQPGNHARRGTADVDPCQDRGTGCGLRLRRAAVRAETHQSRDRGTQAKSGVLDPEGGALEAGPDLYAKLMRNLATSMNSCLSQ